MPDFFGRPEWAGVVIRFEDQRMLALSLPHPETRIEVVRRYSQEDFLWSSREAWDRPPQLLSTRYEILLKGDGIPWQAQGTGHLWTPPEIEARRALPPGGPGVISIGDQ